MRHAWLVAVVCCVCAPAARAAEEKTLADCIAIALAQHPSLKAASASVDAAGYRVRAAAATYLPQVDAFYNANRREISPAAIAGILPTGGVTSAAPSRRFNQFNTGVSFSQLLFDFGQTLNAIRAAQAAERSLEADRSTQQDAVVFNVKQAYFNVLATRRLLDVADETVRQNQKHLDQAQARYDVGLAAKFDVTQAQVQLAQAELNQVSARNNVAVGRATLRNALGLTGPLDFEIVDTFDVHAAQVTEEQALALAYDNRPELLSIRAQAQAAAAQIKVLQKDHLPTVTGSGNYQWSGADYPLQPNWNIGAAVTLSIFNGGLTSARVAEQTANLANLKYAEEVVRQNIALEVRQDTLDLQQAQESIRVADKGVQQARENLELAEGRYGTGVGNIIELTDAQASRTTAEANYVQALYTCKTALAALEKATAHALAAD